MRYYDPETGIDHLVGIGYLRMRVPDANEERLAVIRSVSTLGVATGMCDGSFSITAGWAEDEQVDIFSSDTLIRVDRPRGGLLNIDIGSQPPTTEIRP